jgi:hypothetical protein
MLEELVRTDGFRHTCGRVLPYTYGSRESETCPACLVRILLGMPSNGWTVKNLQAFWDKIR